MGKYLSMDDHNSNNSFNNDNNDSFSEVGSNTATFGSSDLNESTELKLGQKTSYHSHHSLVAYYWTNLALLEQGTGLDQQKKEFEQWLANQRAANNNQEDFKVVAEFTDKHLKRTKPRHFPELQKAVAYCLQNDAKLVVARLNGLISQKEFSDLLATDNLDFACVDKNLVTPEVLSVVRQYVEEQSKQHGASIKRGLQLTDRKLGNPNAAKAITPFNKIKTENSVLFALLLQPVISDYQKKGLSQRKMVEELNDAGIVAPEGGKWVLSQLQKVLKRINTNNLAIQLADQVPSSEMEQYSAADLIGRLNERGVKPLNYETWDEDIVKASKKRKATISNVLELYEFIQKYRDQINAYIAQGKNLTAIAQELNKQSIPIPHTLMQEQNDIHWSSQTVELLMKRMNNELKLPYDNVVLKDFSDALTNYTNSTQNTAEREIYSHTAVKSLVDGSQGTDNITMNSRNIN